MGKRVQMRLKEMTKIGIDVGSTTAKVVAMDGEGRIVFSRYARHNAKAVETICGFLEELKAQLGTGGELVSVAFTGSVGMGFSERLGMSFVQEVVAAARAIQMRWGAVRTMIDIGGEDAKVVFFDGEGKAADLRMNGNCAGGTGAFIDQMAVILNVGVNQLNALALEAKRIYPIASRCGVFCKTDIQNLLAENVSREDIAASIFHAVAIQTVSTLAKGYDIEAPVLMCGGPLTFIPALRRAFADYLGLKEDEGDEIINPDDGALIPAIGAALESGEGEEEMTVDELLTKLRTQGEQQAGRLVGLPAIFASAEEYQQWKARMADKSTKEGTLKEGENRVFIGIDSGSTTTKIVAVDEERRIVYSYYSGNAGSAIAAVEKGLRELQAECEKNGATLKILGSCSTGYGEDLTKAAFQLDNGIVETMAHYLAASYFDKEVSFILDIGGQDMKAIFVDNGLIDRIEINEACSSGCGSFVETFAKTLGYTAGEFAQAACEADGACDLGTRCTVFMNSKVKQALREGATIGEIAAGLALSVVKNCLYKVLKLKDVGALGQHIVVQGGTMRNDAVVRALETLTGAEVRRSERPELMGAFGCALYAMEHRAETERGLTEIVDKAHYEARRLHCKGCKNQCAVTRYRFDNGGTYYSGNKCEKVFTNGGRGARRGANAYLYKNELLFGRTDDAIVESPLLTIGIPRVLNMFEEYPFWHTLLTQCGIRVVLSQATVVRGYEETARMVMSDNICFPAKVVHSHVKELAEAGVDRIFLPFVVHEGATGEQNSYNCPVVTGYSAVVKSVQKTEVAVDSPTISFRDRQLLARQCEEYLGGLGVKKATVRKALKAAEKELERYGQMMAEYDRLILEQAKAAGRLTILLAGRPYHADPLIQHDVAEMIADLGIDVVTDDIVRGRNGDGLKDTNLVAQWAFPNRILKAARWAAGEGRDVQVVEMTSFGCGPDAFLTDELRDLLLRHGKALTLLKLDDISNVGSMKLRVRSLVESLKLRHGEDVKVAAELATTAIYTKEDRRRKILAPFFTPFLSPLIPSVLRLAGYEVENLPLSDTESSEWGLRYANNEVCYPATLIVGDVVKAFVSGRYDPKDCAVAITQTGGQCRASNYVALIKKALADAGYGDVPVVTVTFGESLGNEQPGFKINWMKLLPVALRAMLYSDCISKFYYAAIVREKEPGQAVRLKDDYLARAETLISELRSNELFDLLEQAAVDFDAVCEDRDCKKVGVVGEIFLKFNPFSHKNVIDWLITKGVEVVPPIIMDFFLQAFVNRKVNVRDHVERRSLSDFLYTFVYTRIRRQIAQVNMIAQRMRYFVPFNDIFEEAEKAEKVITLSAQFGEGWLLPGEVMSMAARGVKNVISLQPFGCIANHIISKGIEKRIRTEEPDINLLSLDFDSGVSDVNVTNRMMLFLENLR